VQGNHYGILGHERLRLLYPPGTYFEA
jgi:hypothetical protein